MIRPEPTRTLLELSGRAHPEPGVWIIHFAWPTNPLPMNGSRGHYRAAARKARGIRDHATYAIRAARIPALGRCSAQVTWWVEDHRIRDVDNLGQLEKRLFDAIVNAGVVADDRPELMTKPRADIRQATDSQGLITRTGFTLTITRLQDVEP